MSNTEFRPVRGPEASIKAQTPVDGYLYFTTDTKKIYQVVNGEFVSVGGSSGLYYAHKAFVDPADLSFTMDDIDGDTLPNIDDLVVNVSSNTERDGFYRVTEIISNDKINTSYLPVGGGGGGGSGGNTGGTIKITPKSPQQDQTVAGKKYLIKYALEIYDNNENPVLTKGTATWIINGVRINGGTVGHGGEYEFDVSPYLDPGRELNSVSVSISANTGGIVNITQNFTWQIKCIDLRLQWSWQYAESYYINTDEFNLTFTPYGNINCIAHVQVDDGTELGVNYFTKELTSSQTGKEQFFTLPNFGYGAHKISMWLTAEVEGYEEIIRSEIISNVLTFTKDGVSPILTVPFFENAATQYSTLQIPFMAYDPNSTSSRVIFYVNGNEVSNDIYDRSLHYWTYVVGISGVVKLSLVCQNEDGTLEDKVEFELNVTPLSLDITEPTGSLTFSLKANAFSGNDEIRKWNQSGVTLSFSDNFDWINGGLQFEKDEKGNTRKYICVKQGTRMTINYNLFNSDSTVREGKNFKICFKAANCYDYEAPVLECFETYSENSALGIKLNAQKAIFQIPNTAILNSQYCENSYIELETEIWPNVADKSEKIKGDRFIMVWVDGVPAGVKAYDSSITNFKHTKATPITIGSDLCDVYIYVAKVYERRLTEEEHLDCFILDAPNVEEMLDRYNRNDILDTRGEISYEKLVEQNPECHAWLYEIPYMTTGKDDKVKKCSYQEYYRNSDKPMLTANDVVMRVQGTSSAAYGVAAFNVRSDFSESGFTTADGEHLDGYSFTDTAVPIDYFCTKVNVASCENANNALNQEWYNRFQPYHDAHRRKTREDGKLYRDCMEFNFGVMFIKDNNQATDYQSYEDQVDGYKKSNVFLDTDNYTKAPYYKQYSVGNMGNDKKNIEVFHDIENPKACCVEVTDNQTAEQFMTAAIDAEREKTIWSDDETINPNMPYEFRYPDGNGDATDEMKRAWLDFVNWMAECNPKAATNAPLPVEETYGTYKFKGFDPPGYEGKENPTGVSLAGLEVSTYAGKYTTDSYERRMAKMLSECEDHLVMDSVMYHYLFIQRHTMVDNVAKNTFWSSEDLQHWDLTKNYDNDTSDGNDNSGYLTYGYGIEPGDLKSNGAPIFNAADSVWFNFAMGLEVAQKALYAALESKGAWDSRAYLALFKEKQNVIPERCWIQDYFRKYIRPRRLGLDSDTYLNRLEGGKKTHQRDQYETYQDFYMDSKYVAGGSFQQSGSIDIRANKPDSVSQEVWENTVIPISFYIDCYASALIGGVNNQSNRLKRGEKYEIPVGRMLTNASDATCYIYGASMVQTIEQLANLYPFQVALTNSPKLRELEVGSDADNYYNDLLKTFDVSSNTMLQILKAQNSGISGGLGNLNLENLKQLKELKINGSTFTGVTLPDGGITETLYLNALSNLKMHNLNNLKEAHLDEGIYENLTHIDIVNTPYMNNFSYNLIMQAPIREYNTHGFEWNIKDTDDLELDENEIIGIKVLDKLIETHGNDAVKLSGAKALLAGSITIELDGEYTVDEYFIYNKYNKIYPKVNISYKSGITVEKAPRIIFKQNDLENSGILFEVLTDGKTSLSVLTSTDGPTGEAITKPIKEQDAENVYYWNLESEPEDYSGESAWSQNDWLCNGIAYTNEELMELIPTEDTEIIPIFTPVTRYYSVNLKDWNGNIISYSTDEDFKGLTFNEKVILPKFIYRENTNEHMRYSFVGWISPTDYLGGVSNPTLIQDFNITQDFNAYAFYKEEDCRKVVSNLEYFKFERRQQVDILDGTGKTISTHNGYEISLKPEYDGVLQGKITLPYMYNNQPIISIGKFINVNSSNPISKITHVYFLDSGTSHYVTVGANAFFDQNQNSALKAVYLPDTIKLLEDNCFAFAPELETVTLNPNIIRIKSGALRGNNALGGKNNKVNITNETFPANLEILEVNALLNNDNLVLTRLPDSLISIGAWALANCKNVSIEKLGKFSDNNSKLTTISSNAFQGSGTNNPKKYLYIGDSVQTIGQNAFNIYYGENHIFDEVCFAAESEDFYGLTPSEMGIKSQKYSFGYTE